MTELTYLAPAKLNLFLHICGRRADGYHELQTVFQFLNYTDKLRFCARPDDQICLYSAMTTVATQDNLVTRAAKLLQSRYATSGGVDIYLEKNIPLGAGLGGGSSNAATTLLALNRLWNLSLTQTDLMAMGLQLGADVPIFIYGKSAWAEGVGEKLTTLVLSEPWYVVLIPPQAINTAEIFSDPELTRNSPPLTIQEFVRGGITTRNDCEPIVRKHYPIVAAAFDWLNQYSKAHLTGTGSCVFAALPTQQEAQKIAAQVPQPFKVIVAQGMNCSTDAQEMTRLSKVSC